MSSIYNETKSFFKERSTVNVNALNELCDKYKTYLILFQARSGSTWLMEVCGKAGLGWPHEWLNPEFFSQMPLNFGCLPPKSLDVSSLEAYILSAAEKYSGNKNCIGLQLNHFQFNSFCRCLNAPFDIQKIGFVMYLRRRDIVQQAISLYKCTSSGIFHSYQIKKGASIGGVDYKPNIILSWLEQLVQWELDTESLLQKLQVIPSRIYYEDIIVQPQLIIDKICAAIEIPRLEMILPDVSLEILRNDQSSLWYRNFYEENGDKIFDTIGKRPALI